MRKEKSIAVRIPDDVDKRISAFAKKLNLNKSDLVRKAILDFLNYFQGIA